MTTDAEQYVSDLPFRPSKVGRREVRFPCPECNDDEGFSMSLDSGLWVCMRASCGARGNLHQLKLARNDVYPVENEVDVVSEIEALQLDAQLGFEREENQVKAWRLSLLNSGDAQQARDYLERRGLGATSKVASLAWLGWASSPPGGATASSGPRKRWTRPGSSESPEPATVSSPGLIVIPYLEPGQDEPSMVKLRYVPPEPVDPKGRPKRYARIAGGSTSLYAPLGLHGDRPVLMVGGELDALSVLQALLSSGMTKDEIPFDVIAPTSESSWSAAAARLDELELDRIVQQKEGSEEGKEVKLDIIIAFDNDDAGRTAAQKAAAAIGRWRCRIAEWPNDHKDANDVLVAGGLDLFSIQAMIDEAESVAAKGIAPTSAFEERVVSWVYREGASGWSTGLPELDDKMGGGLRPGEITILTGHTGAGKSIFSSQIALEFRSRGQRVWWHPAELGVEDQISRCVYQMSGQEARTLPLLELRRYVQELTGIWWLDHYGNIEVDAYLETLRYVVHRLSVDLILIDHRDYLIKRGGKDRWEQLDDLFARVVKLIQSSHAHCILVAHPAAPPRGYDRDDWAPQMGDLKGHSDASQDTHNFWSLYRPRSTDRSEKPEKGLYKAGLVVCKCRNTAGDEGMVHLNFDKRRQLYRDPSLDSPF